MNSLDLLKDAYRRNIRIPQILAGILALFVLYAVVQLASIGISALKTFERRTAAVTSISPTHTKTIADLHLFGFYSNAYGNLPETQLQLRLEGTEVSLNSASYSRAIISGFTTPGKSYAVGQLVPGGALIHEILPDRVILNHNGVLEELRMVKPKLQYSSPTGVSLQP